MLSGHPHFYTKIKRPICINSQNLKCFSFFFHDLPKNRSYPFSPPLFNILVPISDPFIVMLFLSCKKNPIIFRFFFRSQKPFTLIFLFKFLLFITSWKIDIFLRYLTHVFSLHISSIGANIKPFKSKPFEKKPVKEKWVVPVSPLSVIILNREFQKCYLLDISCSSYEFGRFIKTGKWVLKIEKATNQAILFELAMSIS